LKEIVGKLASSLAPTPSRIRVEGESFRLPVDATTPFALILHELATNALKYGAWSKERASRCGVVATVANINAHGGTAANREGSRGVGLEWQGE
jgi:two-component sensor histidine kinase